MEQKNAFFSFTSAHFNAENRMRAQMEYGKLHFHTPFDSYLLCFAYSFAATFFPRSFALFSLTHNLCRVKYVWKKRYSFLFFKLYCTKNVNSENATTSNDQHTDTQEVYPASYEKCDVTYYYLYLKYTTEPIFGNGISRMIRSVAVVGIDCNLPLLVQQFFFSSTLLLLVPCCLCVYIVRWWIINANYRFSVVMLMTDQQWMRHAAEIQSIPYKLILSLPSHTNETLFVCVSAYSARHIARIICVYFVNTFQMSGLINISSTENIII